MNGAHEPIPAATVILLRDGEAPRGPQALMVERHGAIAFAGGALVFPGGRIDPGDEDPAWRGQAQGLLDDPALARGQIAAAREAFEETGLLLARRRGGASFVEGEAALALSDWRARIEGDDRLFLEMMRAHHLVIAADAIHPFAHWIAPASVHKRFDTLFFAAMAPPGQIPQADGREALEALFLRPADAIAASEAGARKIIFPTRRNLERLAAFDDCAAILADAASRVIKPICPAVEQCPDGPWLTIPDDQGHPVTAEKLTSAMRD